MTREFVSYKKVTITEISHSLSDNERLVKEENFDLESYENEIRADERRKTITELEARLLKFKYSDENVCEFLSVGSALTMLEQMKEQK